MSQSLIVFEPSGKVLYQQNNKISPFNELIHNVVNETFTELDHQFITTSGSSGKRFYCLTKDSLKAAVYFDSVTTLDGDKIRHSLSDVVRTYAKLHEEPEKMAQLIDFQFKNLIRLKPQETDGAAAGAVTGSGAVTGTAPVSEAGSGTATPKKKAKNGKKMRKWVNGELVDATDDVALDYSSASGSADTSQTPLQVDQTAFTRKDDLVLISELQDVLGSDEEEEEEEAVAGNKFMSKISSYFGSNVDIKQVSKKFTDQLISKNIAPPTAQAIIERIEQKLSKNVTVATFKQALTEELTKILTPNVSTDLLYDIKKRRDRPYVISVVGVNGVGKSTNLAKLAFWLLQNNMNVLICACDTFRSGAVEQLKVHVNNLARLNESAATQSKIELFEKGYGGGDHVVNTAKSAIAHAATHNFDVVLIDTAGRTHSNAKLMAPLKKFGDAADPDKIIMVGEALVGTDSVEQAVNFNNAFGNRRGLNFFIISKVDTVGDLVGAMINMVMATKVPILFVGTGQTYTDIKKLSVKRVVEMLTS